MKCIPLNIIHTLIIFSVIFSSSLSLAGETSSPKNTPLRNLQAAGLKLLRSFMPLKQCMRVHYRANAMDKRLNKLDHDLSQDPVNGMTTAIDITKRAENGLAQYAKLPWGLRFFAGRNKLQSALWKARSAKEGIMESVSSSQGFQAKGLLGRVEVLDHLRNINSLSFNEWNKISHYYIHSLASLADETQRSIKPSVSQINMDMQLLNISVNRDPKQVEQLKQKIASVERQIKPVLKFKVTTNLDDYWVAQKALEPLKYANETLSWATTIVNSGRYIGRE